MGVCSIHQQLEQRHKSTVISCADDRHMGGRANKKKGRQNQSSKKS